MKIAKIMAAAFIPVAAAVLATATSGIANATPTTAFGVQQMLNGTEGDIGYTVKNLTPSNDRIPVQVNGRLYESTVTAAAVRDSVTPLIPQFNARAANGNTYPALFQAATPQGLSPRSLDQGDSSTGKVYFDVVGEKPDSVVVNNNAEDLLIWKS